MPANEDTVAQNGVVEKLPAHRPRVVAQRLTPIGCIDTGHCELVLRERPISHRVEEFVLLTEVPINTRHSDIQVPCRQRHAQVVDGDLRRHLEGAGEDPSTEIDPVPAVGVVVPSVTPQCRTSRESRSVTGTAGPRCAGCRQ